MIIALAGRVIGPVATLMLLAFLAGYPAQYTSIYAIIAAYTQLATAPLNPYTEHFKLREILHGRSDGLKAGLFGLFVIWLASTALILGLGHSKWLLCVVPLLGLGHLLTKFKAAQLRANNYGAFAIALEFALRPTVLLLFVGIIFFLAGPSNGNLLWAFALTGLTTIIAAIAMMQKFRSVFKKDGPSDFSSERSSPIAFVLLGMFMVIASQFEVFALGWLNNIQALADYKVALQLASICGIATNFVLMNNLRDLYSHATENKSYHAIFRKVQKQTVGMSIFFIIIFILIGLFFPLLWSRNTWWLSAFGSMFFAVAAAFGPIGSWLYSKGRLDIVFIAILITLIFKLTIFTSLYFLNWTSSVTFMAIFGVGTLIHNISMYLGRYIHQLKSKDELSA